MSMMDRIIRWSIVNRLFVVIAALAVTAYGAVTALRMPVDVFPDLTAPTVTVVTEAHGLAPQEVETLVTFPIESAVNGATGVRRVRSASGIGISIVWVEFEWGTDKYIARQIVNEKLQLVATQLPPEVAARPRADLVDHGRDPVHRGRSDRHTPMEVRDVADWTVRRRLLAVPGVAQVVPIGGEVRQYQVRGRSGAARGLRRRPARRRSRRSNASTPTRPAGSSSGGGQEALIHGVGRVGGAPTSPARSSTVRDGVPVLVGHVAEVELGPAIEARRPARRTPSRRWCSAIQKQPGANTLELTARIDRELDAIQRGAPEGMTIERDKFRQADFIEHRGRNVSVALRDGAILVAVILFLFLVERCGHADLAGALPLSLVVASSRWTRSASRSTR
jgi:Cu/Ag efflux pump CusA